MKLTDQQSKSPMDAPKGQTRIRFLDDESQHGVVVACETEHPGGMLAPLVKGLSRLQLEVHQIESKLSGGVRSERLLVATPDGTPLSQRRQALLRTAVFNAMDSMNQSVANLNASGPELSAS
jgi:UTP:GlnB (protein PII) uridylyltransferase